MMKRRQQQGLTLIELMIAIALSMSLMAGAMQFMVSSKKTFEFNDDISRIQENGRLALDIIVKDIRMAGYRRPQNGDGKIPHFFDFTVNCLNTDQTCAKDDQVSSTTISATSDPITNGSDRLSVQYDPPEDDDTPPTGTATDCLGNELDNIPDHIIINVYTIQTTDNINSLYCRGYDKTAGAWVEPDGSAQPLIDGIDNMQILYGVTSIDDASGSVTRYVSQDKLNEDDWPYVRAVRIALLVNNGLETGFADAKSRSYRVLNSDLLETAATDKRARRIYSTTVLLNNSSY
jgi:type IV pilus assembly protein PilW